MGSVKALSQLTPFLQDNTQNMEQNAHHTIYQKEQISQRGSHVNV